MDPFNPTAEAIHDVLELLPHGRKLGVFSNNDLYHLSDGRLVKVGLNTSLNEAHAMVTVRTHTRIPVPEVYMVFESGGMIHIVMEFIPGIQLTKCPPEKLHDRLIELHGFIDEIRELGKRFPLQNSRFGSWPESGRYVNSSFHYHNSFDANLSEGLNSVDQFHTSFLTCLQWLGMGPTHQIYQDLKEVRRQSQEHSPVLSHGDLSPRNVLVDSDGNTILAIIDWPEFGWYPDFWEDMGMRNQVVGSSFRRARDDVFGEATFASKTYAAIYNWLSILVLHDPTSPH